MLTATRPAATPIHLSDAQARAMLVERARGLHGVLSKNALQTETDRRVVEENIQAMAEAGLFRTMVPRRYDGFEGSIRTHLEVTAAVAEACGSSAWVLALTNVCNWFASLYGQQAQDEIFGANPNARVAGVLSPSTQVQRVEGGLKVSGKWFWSSGCMHADWGMLGVLELDKNGAPLNQYMAVIPMSELSIENTWFTAGMKGTGSNCVVANDVFVPTHRLLSTMPAVHGDYPTPFKDEAAYRAAFIPVAALVLVGAQLGMARAALNYVIEKASQRAIAYTSFKKQSDSVAFQMQIAKAALKIDTAHLHAFRAADDIDSAAQRGEYLDYKTRARVRADTGYVAQYATDAINMLMTAHGAGSFADASPMQRIWRDANTAARHAIVLQPVGDEIYGKALLDAENTVTPLV
ncbi:MULTISPECIES: acyl-CoA dehydrogenase family protein [unclassified Variovorax]|uniref:acyl-CoA dehydrogenase family protein n=1 Tax=unclassified Variovorax TaxID=663243 RepID=UPI001BD6BD82|nr:MULTISPECIES: acyl-CoA dehydrogenase family protein [unclassified Variovorax]